MVIDKKILDELTAKENPRLRCNDMVPGGWWILRRPVA